ncbi:MAG: hypothetical protein B6U86_00345 [Candidatus Altiarchaeales archaeon ex4484_43]|nr:MAG: hypothetical protein B6U86_00345 [Candidatus Altiarchaeales archaeon ex4484_43]
MKSNLGQMGPIGEDLISLVIIVLAIVTLLMALNTIYTSYVVRNAELDMYRMAWITADKLSTEWARTDPSNVTHSRLLDLDRICKNWSSIPEYGLNLTVTDLREKKRLCSCGSSFSNETKIARIPVALRFNYTDVHPGVIEVRIWRK